MPDLRPLEMVVEDLCLAAERGEPRLLVRLGDGELRVLRGDPAPLHHAEGGRVDDQESMAALRDRMVGAIAAADWVGWHQDPWLTSELERLGLLPWLRDRSIYAFANLCLGSDPRFVRTLLAEQRCVLVGAPMARWHAEYLLPRGLGQGAIVWQGATVIGRASQAEEICAAVRQAPARVALISMGIWAPWIAHEAARSGKVALDWGHLPDHNLSPVWRERGLAYDLNLAEVEIRGD